MESKGFNSFSQILTYIIKYFKWVVVAAVILLLLSGIYRVESNEVAVVLRFGKIVGNIQSEQVMQPGLHFSFPFFVDEVIKIPVQTIHEKAVITHFGTGERVSADIKTNGYLLTGDNNVVLIKAKAKYKIDNAADYALYSSNPEKTIDGILSGELTSSITKMDIDAVLTSGKAKLASQMINNSQKMLDEIKSGIIITNVELTDIIPPLETKKYFENVINAAVSKETSIQQAKEKAISILIQAESEANSYIQDAALAQSNTLAFVKAEIAQFDGAYEQYIKNPEVIIDGIFRQRTSDLFYNMGGSIVVPETGEPPIIVVP